MKKDAGAIFVTLFSICVFSVAAFFAGSYVSGYFSDTSDETHVLSESSPSEESDDSSEYETYDELPDDPPEMFIDTQKDYTAVLKTSAGDITIDLFEKETPITVNNFVFLSINEFYNNTTFHRVLEDFIIQGGDPTGTGRGGPGYQFDDELPVTRDYNRGVVAMANAGKNTNGSQFFIMHKDYDISKDYVIFGEVTSGMEVVDVIATAEVVENDLGEMAKPVDPVTVNTVEISVN